MVESHIWMDELSMLNFVSYTSSNIGPSTKVKNMENFLSHYFIEYFSYEDKFGIFFLVLLSAIWIC